MAPSASDHLPHSSRAPPSSTEQVRIGEIELVRLAERLIGLLDPSRAEAEEGERAPDDRMPVVEHIRLAKRLLRSRALAHTKARDADAEPGGARRRLAARRKVDLLRHLVVSIS